MRWFLTDEAPDLEAALRSSGEEVVSAPAQHARRYVNDAGFHPAHYPLVDLTMSARAEVVALVDPIRMVAFGDHAAEFGYSRAHGRTLRNRGVTIVMFAADNPTTLQNFRRGLYRTCACQPNDAAVHIVSSDEAGDMVRGQRRVALWRPGESTDRIVAAVQHARQGKTYSPRQQGHEWG